MKDFAGTRRRVEKAQPAHAGRTSDEFKQARFHDIT